VLGTPVEVILFTISLYTLLVTGYPADNGLMLTFVGWHLHAPHTGVEYILT